MSQRLDITNELSKPAQPNRIDFSIKYITLESLIKTALKRLFATISTLDLNWGKNFDARFYCQSEISQYSKNTKFNVSCYSDMPENEMVKS